MPEEFSPEFIAGFKHAQMLAEAIVQRARANGDSENQKICRKIFGNENLQTARKSLSQNIPVEWRGKPAEAGLRLAALLLVQTR